MTHEWYNAQKIFYNTFISSSDSGTIQLCFNRPGFTPRIGYSDRDP